MALAAIAVIWASTAGAPTAALAAKAEALQSPLGSYVAGRIARSSNDPAAAVRFYRHALTSAPDDPLILEQAFLAEAVEGDASRTVPLARRLVVTQPNHRLARTWLGIDAFKRQLYATADRHFAKAGTGPIGELTSALSRAWVAVALNNRKTALSRLKFSQQAEWAQYYLRYHRALISDLTNNSRLARANFDRVFKSDARMPRITIGYLRHAARLGNFELAGTILEENRKATSGEIHPAVADVAAKIERRETLDLLVVDHDQGLAEVFYGLGEALATEGGTNLGAIYLQMAIHLRPDFPFALAALANVYESAKRYDLANDTYARIQPGSSLHRSIDLRRAVNLDALERTDEAIGVLERLSNERPDDVEPLETLGNILRGRKRYKEAIVQYTRLIEIVGTPRREHWTYWYARGTCYEQTKDWPRAEKDLLKANELSPDQPLVLNYLGYSWVDRNEHLKKGLEFIERAVALKPDDGYIVDSLGWAHYRLGNFEQATKQLERAVELRPADPILNDHLGDAYWRVGRTREARYQWEQSLTLSPEPENAIKTREKLLGGLPPAPNRIAATKADLDKNKPGLSKSVESNAGTTAPTPVR